jgi:hypothetical protein
MTQPIKRRRRAPGEGSLTKRKDGIWAGMIDLGWQDGKRKRKFVYARMRAEAARKMADAQRDLSEGRLIADERTTVEHYLRAWLEMIEPTIALSTTSATDSCSGSMPIRTSASCGSPSSNQPTSHGSTRGGSKRGSPPPRSSSCTG